jgi:hypothetical protein
MKAYQDHDPVADKGKAEPKPKRPTTHSSKKPWNIYPLRGRNAPCCIRGHKG